MIWYLDIETTGLDPKVDKIITIQYAKLERGTGKQVGDLKILKRWEMPIHEMITTLIRDTSIDHPYAFMCIPVGYNLDFENRFLRYMSLGKIDLSLRPKIDLFSLGILINGGEFKGSGLDQITNKKQSGRMIPTWYANHDYNLIIDYIEDETKSFVKWYSNLHNYLPTIKEKLLQ